MHKDYQPALRDRRSFLKLAGASVVGGGAAAMTAVAPAAAETDAEPKPGQLYRETEHVKRYYELAKFL
jgi:hypothetical protein